MSQTKFAYKCHITGKVQGVFFRQSTKDAALRLGITGWVKNETDGSVTCVMCSDDLDALTELQSWCHRGPIGAKVQSVEVGPCPVGDWTDFSIR